MTSHKDRLNPTQCNISLCVGMGADIATHWYIISGTVIAYLSK